MRIYKYKSEIFSKIQKCNRKINALIRQNQIRRIKVFVLIFYAQLIALVMFCDTK